MITDDLKEQLIRDEALRLKPYRCSENKLTIAVGRNLDDNGITEAEAMYLLDNDLKRVVSELTTALPWIEQLSIVRASVLINMCFNLGIKRFLRFKKTLKYVSEGDYINASIEMLDSRWAEQVGKRATRLSEQMRSGTWR